MIGKVIEVFIPNNDFNMIGFKILIDDELLSFIMKQDFNNSSLYKDDFVKVNYTDDSVSIEVLDND